MTPINCESYYWQNDLVRLRAMGEGDWEPSCHNRFDSAARFLLQYEVELPPTTAGEQEAVRQFVGFAPGTGRLMFTIENLAGENVGAFNLNSIDERNGTFGIGIQIDRRHRGKGYGTAAMRLLLRYAFFGRRLHKLNNSVLAGNAASARMFEKLGAVVEGRRRETVFSGGKYYDEILVGLTREEFEQNEARLQAGDSRRT
jgi:RimJ/RimL family protein N-acetyltransferase